MIECKECGKKFRSIAPHVLFKHSITLIEYYNKHIGKTFCKKCGKPSKWKNFREGYEDFCSTCRPKGKHSKGVRH